MPRHDPTTNKTFRLTETREEKLRPILERDGLSITQLVIGCIDAVIKAGTTKGARWPWRKS